MKVTRELLQDTAENILGFLNKWIAKEVKSHKKRCDPEETCRDYKHEKVAISTVDDLKTVFNVTLDPAIAASSIVLTNQSGFNYLDTLKG